MYFENWVTCGHSNVIVFRTSTETVSQYCQAVCILQKIVSGKCLVDVCHLWYTCAGILTTEHVLNLIFSTHEELDLLVSQGGCWDFAVNWWRTTKTFDIQFWCTTTYCFGRTNVILLVSYCGRSSHMSSIGEYRILVLITVGQWVASLKHLKFRKQ